MWCEGQGGCFFIFCHFKNYENRFSSGYLQGYMILFSRRRGRPFWADLAKLGNCGMTVVVEGDFNIVSFLRTIGIALGDFHL